jgi:hypothetical protein
MSINKPESPAPLICKIQYQFEHMVEFLPGSGKHQRKVNILNDSDWLNIYHTPGSAEFSEPQVQNPNGPLFDQQLKIRLPGQLAEHYDKMQDMDETPVIIKITYSDGGAILMGEPGNPVLYYNAFGSDAKKTGHDYMFKCMSTHRAYIFESTEGGLPIE